MVHNARTWAGNPSWERCLCFITRNDQTLCFPLSYDNMLITKVSAWYNTPLLYTTLPCETRWHCQGRWLCSPLHAVLLDYKRFDHRAFSVRRMILLINLIGRYRNWSCSIETTLIILWNRFLWYRNCKREVIDKTNTSK